MVHANHLPERRLRQFANAVSRSITPANRNLSVSVSHWQWPVVALAMASGRIGNGPICPPAREHLIVALPLVNTCVSSMLNTKFAGAPRFFRRQLSRPLVRHAMGASVDRAMGHIQREVHDRIVHGEICYSSDGVISSFVEAKNCRRSTPHCSKT